MAGGVLAAVAVAGAAAWRRRSAPPDTVAPSVAIVVAPFKASSAQLQFWHEGMVDLLSRNLDGAGPLRSVAPAVSLKKWSGSPAGTSPRDAARALGRQTGARYAVFGSIAAAAGGGVRLTGWLLDVQTDSLSPAFERDGVEATALADSLTVDVLRDVGRTFEVGAVRRGSAFGNVSVAALKPFLEGEQAYRRTAWEPALAAYRRALALDTSFALAYHRVGSVAGWQRDGADSVTRENWLRAGALNRSLGRRDSLLVLVDSLRAALASRRIELPDWALERRLFAAANEAAALYPDDPEVWLAVGEAREHEGYGRLAGVTEASVLEAFDRGLALDSGFTPAYIHAIERAFVVRGAAEGRRYARAYLDRQPTDEVADAVRAILHVTDPAVAGQRESMRFLDTLPTGPLSKAALLLLRWPDSAHTALTLLRTVAGRPVSTTSTAADSVLIYRLLPLELAYRGRFREAYELLGSRRSKLFSELALLGGVPPDTARAAFARWLAEGSPHAQLALSWWSAERDTASIISFARRADSPARSRGAAPAAAYGRLVAAAYLSLSRRTTHDTTEALRLLGQASDSLCLTCYIDRLTEARLLSARGRDREALTLLSQRLYTTLTPAEIWIAAERGRVATRLGDRDAAARSYRLVIAAWADGDPEVQRWVADARRALAAPGVVASASALDRRRR
jgi:eukaryotic-like serine/threonine-protein kinase